MRTSVSVTCKCQFCGLSWDVAMTKTDAKRFTVNGWLDQQTCKNADCIQKNYARIEQMCKEMVMVDALTGEIVA